jgi:transcription elongation factor SPT6
LKGGNLVNRVQFIKSGLFTSKIFINAAGFLRISQDDVDTRHTSKQQRSRGDDDNTPDPLDDTRIHPEDYDLARKMASDALELDEEDIHDFHPSHVVTQIMADNEGAKKLADLNLDDFAVSLYNANEDKKRHTLNVIREELHKPFAEHRRSFEYLGAWEVLTMLSGETPKTLRVGLIITVLVRRITPNFVQVRLDSGVDGVINNHYLTDGPSAKGVVNKDQTIRGVIIHVTLDSEKEHYLVELSSRVSDLTSGDTEFRRIKYDEHWDVQQYEKDRELLERKKRAEEIGRTRRIIKHPNFHNFNASQAEAYLEKQQRGDVVIRPSSKGINHLAVTWKVDERLFQHIGIYPMVNIYPNTDVQPDVTELNPDMTGQGIGGPLLVDDTHNYADLDELIVNHVQAMARRVEELMAHERFKPGSEDELRAFPALFTCS